MENYKELYFKLFNSISDTIENLKEFQRQAEEFYINLNNDSNENE